MKLQKFFQSIRIHYKSIAFVTRMNPGQFVFHVKIFDLNHISFNSLKSSSGSPSASRILYQKRERGISLSVSPAPDGQIDGGQVQPPSRSLLNE